MDNTIEAAILALASVDTDHAQQLNGVGYNGRDTAFGNSLAVQLRSGKKLSARQASAGHKMLRTYQTQLLRDFGIDYQLIPRPDALGPVAGVTGRIEVGRVRAVIFTSRPQKLVLAFPWLELKNGEYLDELLASFSQNVVESNATDSDIEVDGLGGELMPFQKAGVAYAVKNHKVMIGDEMGLGKTVQALATILHEQDFPAVLVVPAVVKLNWEREIKKWLPGVGVTVLTGRKSHELGGKALRELYVINYDVLSYWNEELLALKPLMVVFDESHYLKNSKAARTKAAKKLARGCENVLMLTGTPVLNRPSELISQLDILGKLSSFGGVWAFAKRYCDGHQGSFGYDMSGASNLEELHERLRAKCYVRRTKEQVLPELPAKRRVTVPMELSSIKAYRAVEDDLRLFFERKVSEDIELKAKIKELKLAPKESAEYLEREAMLRHQRAMQAEILTRIEALKQECARLKSESVKLWVEDFLTSGKKLVLFATHKDIIADLVGHFEGSVSITGDTPMQTRQDAVDAFQNDDDCRLIILNIQAGGVGITLTAASDVAFVELPWRPGDLDQAEDRCHRIGQDDSVTAWYLLAAETIEEDIAKLIDGKRQVVDAATDGEVDGDEVGILNALMAALTEGKG